MTGDFFMLSKIRKFEIELFEPTNFLFEPFEPTIWTIWTDHLNHLNRPFEPKNYLNRRTFYLNHLNRPFEPFEPTIWTIWTKELFEPTNFLKAHITCTKESSHKYNSWKSLWIKYIETNHSSSPDFFSSGLKKSVSRTLFSQSRSSAAGGSFVLLSLDIR